MIRIILFYRYIPILNKLCFLIDFVLWIVFYYWASVVRLIQKTAWAEIGENKPSSPFFSQIYKACSVENVNVENLICNDFWDIGKYNETVVGFLVDLYCYFVLNDEMACIKFMGRRYWKDGQINRIRDGKIIRKGKRGYSD